MTKTCGLSDVTDQNFAGIARWDNKCCEHYFQRGFCQSARAGTATARALDARLHAAFGRIPVPSCVSIAIPPGLQTIAFHNPSSFKEEKCL